MSSGSPSQEPDPGSRSRICFADRQDAGEQLATAILAELDQHPNLRSAALVVYALPRGGVQVAAPIAQRLGCPLDVIVAKKITRPENPELAIGAVTADGHVLWSPRIQSSPSLSSQMYDVALAEAQGRAQAQWAQFVPYRPQASPTGAIALLVDDGIATGMTMAVAVQSLRVSKPAEIWICVPVAPPEILPYLRSLGDFPETAAVPVRTVVVATPTPFNSVSRFYQEFPQVPMAVALECLATAQLYPSNIANDS